MTTYAVSGGLLVAQYNGNIPVPYNLGTFVNGRFYTYTIVNPYSGGINTYTSSGVMPYGLTLNSATGIISGTYYYQFATPTITTRINITNSINSQQHQIDITWNGELNNTSVTWVSPADQLGTLKSGSSYTFTFVANATNPIGPTTYSLVNGTLPVNAVLNTTSGVLSGTVTLPSNLNMGYIFTIAATNNNITSERVFGYKIGPGDTLVSWVSPSEALSPSAGGSNYNFTPNVTVNNPVGSTTFSLQSGKLPVGTILNTSTGVISGILTNSTSSYTFTIRATNNGITSDRTFTGTVTPTTVITWNGPAAGSLGSSTEGTAYNFAANTSTINPVGSTTYSVLSGSLPAGTNLNPSTGVISGILTNASPSYSFTIRATNNGITSDRLFTGTVISPPIWITPSGQLVNGAVGESYTTPLVASSAISYAIVSGILPKGLTLNPTTGVISGIPTEITQNATLIKSFPYMTSDTNPMGYSAYAYATIPGTSTLTSTGVLQTPNTAYQLFDNSQFTMAAFNQQNNGTNSMAFPFILGMTSPYKVNVSSYDVTCFSDYSSGNAIKSWSLQGSNDGTNWTTVDTRSNITSWPANGFSKLSFTLPNAASYYRYRLNITDIVDPVNHTMLVSDLSFYGYASVFTVRATAANGLSSDRQFGIQINVGTTSVSWISPAEGALGASAGGSNYSFIANTSVINPVGATTYSIISGSVPAGTTFNPSTGAISGILVNATDSYSFTMRVANNNKTADRTFTGTVNDTTTVISWISPTEGPLGISAGGSTYNFVSNVSVINPVGATIYSIISGSVPAGTTLNTATGVISGTLTNAASSYSFTIRATNNTKTADRAFTGSVTDTNTIIAWISPDAGSLGTSSGGTAYNFTANTSVINPVGATTYSVISGTLPAGTVLNTATGSITGVLSNSNFNYAFTLRATNNKKTADRSFTGTVIDTTTYITWVSPTAGALGSSAGGASFSFISNTSVINPVGSTTYSILSGSLPAGTILNMSTGVISGTLVNSASNYLFTLRATNNNKVADRAFTGSVTDTNTYITWVNPAAGALGASSGGSTYNFISNTSVINPVGPTIYSLQSGALPSGTSLNASTGVISGILVNTASNYSFTIRATNNGKNADRLFTGTVTDTSTVITWIRPTEGSFGTSTGGTPYNFISNTSVINPVGITIYSIVTGNLPAGTSLNATTGVISGILTNAASSYSFTIRATNNNKTADRAFTGLVTDTNTVITWVSPAGTLGASAGGTSYNFISNTSVINPVGATTYAIISGSLPAGTTLNTSTGIISGTLLNAASSYAFTIRATNNTKTADRDFTGTVTDTNTYISWVSPAAGDLGASPGGSAYNFISNVSVINPVGPTTYSVFSGRLPAGTTLNTSTGVISGRLTNAASIYTFTIRASNNTKTADRTFTGSITDTNTYITWVGPSEGPLGASSGGSTYSFISNTSVINPVGSTTYSVISGSLPLGTILNPSTGVISGTLTNAALNYSFTLRATNNSKTADRTFTGSVTDTNTYVSWVSPTAGALGASAGGTSYNFISNTSVINPVGATTYSVISGSLPLGTTLDTSTGVISGILLNAASNYAFTLRATNNNKFSDRSFTGSVIDTNTYIVWVSPAAGALGASAGGSTYSFISNTSVINPVGATTYAITAGNLPAGTTLNASTGVISGTLVNSASNYAFTLRATNNGKSADRAFTGSVTDTNTVIIWVSPDAGSLGPSSGGSVYRFISNTSVTNPVGQTIYSIIAGSLPLGTSLDKATGIISGTLVNSASTYTFTIRATNNSKTADRVFTGSVIDTNTVITWVSPDAGSLGSSSGGTPYKFISNTSVINPVGSTTYSIIAGSLPFGTTLNPSTGIISGILPNAASSYNFTIRATNNSKIADRSFTGTVMDTKTSIAWISPSAGSLGSANGGAAYSFIANTSVINPVGSTTYSVIAGSLPVGTTLNTSTGVISGTLTNYDYAYDYSFTIRATNNRIYADRAFFGNITYTTISWISPAAGNLGISAGGSSYLFLSNVSVINPVGLTTYSVIAGNLPAGTTLNTSTGVISGTLTNPSSSYSFTLRATNNAKNADRTFTGSVSSITSINWVSPNAGNLGVSTGGTAYNFIANTSVINPVGPTTYSLASGSLPAGTTLNSSTGVISGTLTNSASSYSFTIRATNNGKSSDRAFTGSVTIATANTTSISWISPAAGSLGASVGGTAYSFIANTSVINPVGTTTYSIISGNIPVGTTLNTSTGIISGILTNSASDYSFTIRATNNSKTADRTFNGTITDTNTVISWISPAEGSLGASSGGTAYNFIANTSVINPVGATTYSIISGSVPAGTTLDASTGVISGTLINSASSYSFTIRATNNSKTADRTFNGTITDTNTVISWISPAEGSLGASSGGTAYNFIANTSVINPVGATTYSIISGSVPAGTTLDASTGVISGTLINSASSYSFTIRATNNGKSADRTFTGTVANIVTSIAWVSPAEGSFGTSVGGSIYNFIANTSVTNPVGATTYSVLSGSIPAGTTFNPSTGVISGILFNSDSNYNFTIRATNNNKSADRSFSGSIINSTIVSWITPAAGPLGTSVGGTSFSFISNTSVINPIGATIYSVLSGSLPAGTMLDTSTGVISGTLINAASNYSFTLRATNNNKSSDRAFSGSVTDNNTYISWVSPAAGSLGPSAGGSTYSFISNTSVINSVGPTTYSVIAGNLPNGTTLDASTGIISGTLINAASNYSFTLRATNNNKIADRSFSGSVTDTNTYISWVSPAAGSLGSSAGGSTYSFISNTSVINSVGSTTYSVISGSLPSGTTLNPSTGVISGTLTNSASSYSFTLRATNNSKTADRTFTGTIIDTNTYVTWVSPSVGEVINATGGTSVTITPNVTVTNPVGPTTYSLASGTLPAGAILSLSTGVISGILTNSANTYIFTVRATNNNVSSDREYNLSVSGITVVTWNSPAEGAQGTFAGGTAYSLVSNTSVINPVGSTTYSILSGNIPVGTTLNTSTGIISGILTNSASDYSFTLRATNNNRTADRYFAGSITLSTIITWISPTEGALGESTGGTSYIFTPNVSVINPVGATTYSIISGSVPAGTTLNTANGVISGTLTNAASSYTFTIRATNNTKIVDKVFTGSVTIAPVTSITWTQVGIGPSQQALTAYTFTPSPTIVNPVGPTTYSLVGGTLPAGTTLDTSTGIVSGILSNNLGAYSKNYSFTLRVTNNGKTANMTFTGTITTATSLRSLSYTVLGAPNYTSGTNLGQLLGNSFFSMTPVFVFDNPFGTTTFSWGNNIAPPAGINLNSTTGVVSGILSNVNSIFQFSLVVNNNGVSTTTNWTGTVRRV